MAKYWSNNPAMPFAHTDWLHINLKKSWNLVMLGHTSESKALSLGAWKNSGESDYTGRVTAPQGTQAIVLHGMCLNTLWFNNIWPIDLIIYDL